MEHITTSDTGSLIIIITKRDIWKDTSPLRGRLRQNFMNRTTHQGGKKQDQTYIRGAELVNGDVRVTCV